MGTRARRGPVGLLMVALLAASSLACSAGTGPLKTSPDDAGMGLLQEIDASSPTSLDAGSSTRGFPAPDATGGEAGPADATVDAPPGRFITEVVSFKQGTCAGFEGNTRQLPEVVYGPPLGAGALAGSLDVVSLGGGGSIVVGFGPNAIVDGPGVDFVVFENPFNYGASDRYVEPGEVSVSEDGVSWTAFPCTDTTQEEPDGGWGATQCAGMNIVYSNPYTNDISPFDLQHAGGDQYDLATIGVPRAKYVRVRNIVASEDCPETGPKPDKNGFDLDAIAIINPALP